MDPLLRSDSIKDGNLIEQIKDLQERTIQLEAHALTSQNIKANKIAVGDGVALGDVSDGEIKTTGGATIGDGKGAKTLSIDGAVEYMRQINFKTGGVARWVLRGADSTAESGGDAGSDFQIVSRHDDGTYLATPIKIFRSTDDIKLGTASDIYTVPWTDLSGTNIVGWSSYTTKLIRYKKVGKLVFVAFFIEGTSDSTAAYFTLPFKISLSMPYIMAAIQGKDAGVYTTVSKIQSAGDTWNAVAKKTLSGTGWTASGIKRIMGQFFYEAA